MKGREGAVAVELVVVAGEERCWMRYSRVLCVWWSLRRAIPIPVTRPGSLSDLNLSQEHHHPHRSARTLDMYHCVLDKYHWTQSLANLGDRQNIIASQVQKMQIPPRPPRPALPQPAASLYPFLTPLPPDECILSHQRHGQSSDRHLPHLRRLQHSYFLRHEMPHGPLDSGNRRRRWQ